MLSQDTKTMNSSRSREHKSQVLEYCPLRRGLSFRKIISKPTSLVCVTVFLLKIFFRFLSRIYYSPVNAIPAEKVGHEKGVEWGSQFSLEGRFCVSAFARRRPERRAPDFLEWV